MRDYFIEHTPSAGEIRQRLAKMVREKRLRIGIIVEQTVVNAHKIAVAIKAEPRVVTTIAYRLAKYSSFCVLTSGPEQILAHLQGNDLAVLHDLAKREAENHPGVLEVTYQIYDRTIQHNTKTCVFANDFDPAVSPNYL